MSQAQLGSCRTNRLCLSQDKTQHICRLAVVTNFQRFTLTPFALYFLICISPHLSVSLDLFSIPFSLYLIMAIVYLTPTEGARWSSGINAANGARGPRFASRVLPNDYLVVHRSVSDGGNFRDN